MARGEYGTRIGAEARRALYTDTAQLLWLPLEDRQKLGVTSTQGALAILQSFRQMLLDPNLMLRPSKADIAGYDLIITNSSSMLGFGVIDDAHVAMIPRRYFETLDAAAIAMGGGGFVNTNIAPDQSADLIRRLGDRMALGEFQDARKVAGTVGQIRQKVDNLIALGTQKLATEKAAPMPRRGSAPVAAPSGIPPIAIGIGAVGVLGILFLATRGG